MKQIIDLLWHRLTGIMPGELNQPELAWLALSRAHTPLLTRRRALLIINRVRLFAFLFAVLTPLWSAVDFLVFPFPLWLRLAVMRFVVSSGLLALLARYPPSGRLPNAYRALALLFFIPAMFYLSSDTLLTTYRLAGFPAAIGAGYAFLPFVLLAGLSIFPLTIAENLTIAIPILLAHSITGYLHWSASDWSFAATLWLLILITGVSLLAGISQLAFMIALVRQANRDPLTGVIARKTGEEMLELQFNIASRGNAPLAVAFIDLDHFKSINDTFGHDAGDQVLMTMTDIVGANLRAGDTLARWGGEEFLVIMPNTDLPQAEAALARLRGIGFGMRPDHTPITASIGVAERMADGSAEWKALVELADQRMYRAKQGGRDRVVSA
ncbi:MAG TPA: GGDEF domain-containing protein [Noviherbaspirillum sp.]|uniref:GGDEF domain-containing protein n=1 Tax=Noviherbaspirillum sp. TaxID=1926288 RepID=UPI002B471533|nr:GGDEF domain-containing protein [Noviherbaspirillum sp.]HJV86188.1 GGDEF domain-containing protein [Noviherbaspirillum sp.]